jgi:hypothetical protein
MRDLLGRGLLIAVVVAMAAGGGFVRSAGAASGALDQPAANPMGGGAPSSTPTVGAAPGTTAAGQGQPSSPVGKAPSFGPSPGSTPGGGTAGQLPGSR